MENIHETRHYTLRNIIPISNKTGKNTNELTESIFQIIRSNKGLLSSKDVHKERKYIPLPTIPKLK